MSQKINPMQRMHSFFGLGRKNKPNKKNQSVNLLFTPPQSQATTPLNRAPSADSSTMKVAEKHLKTKTTKKSRRKPVRRKRVRKASATTRLERNAGYFDRYSSDLQQLFDNLKSGSCTSEHIRSLPQNILDPILSAVVLSYPDISSTKEASERIKADPSLLLTINDSEGKNLLIQIAEVLDIIHHLYLDVTILQRCVKDLEEGKELSSTALDNFTSFTYGFYPIGQYKLLENKQEKIDFLKQAIDQIKNKNIPVLRKAIKPFSDLHKKPNECTYDTSLDRVCTSLEKNFAEMATTVTMVGAEFSGLLKQGGLAEAIEGMARGVKEHNPENNVRLVFPKYSTLPQAVLDSITEQKEYLDHNGKAFTVHTAHLHGIEIHLIEDDIFSLDKTNPSIYGPDGETQKKRFATFSSLAADLIGALDDDGIVHLHDWHAAGVALKIRNQEKLNESGESKRKPIVFTFHNNNRMAQGRLTSNAYNYHLLQEAYQEAGITSHNSNFFVETLKAADMVTTVSKTFGMEAQTPRLGEGISRSVKKTAEAGKLIGIINGSNPHRWNPTTDKTLLNWKDPETGEATDLSFSPDNTDTLLTQKRKNKVQLNKWLQKHLPQYSIDPDKPTVFYVGRFDSYQKGLDKFGEAMEATLKNGGQFICMGSQEDGTATRILDELQEKYGDKVIFLRDYKAENGKYYYQQGDPELGRQGIGSVVRAASDFLLVPSSFEPCGLVQFEGWLFGSQAIGANTGGLADTIIDARENKNQANGYLFDRNGKGDESLSGTIATAFSDLAEKSDQEKAIFIQRMMKAGKKYSWITSPHGRSPVENYLATYKIAQRNARKIRQLPSQEHHFDIQQHLYQRAITNPYLKTYNSTSTGIEDYYLAQRYFSDSATSQSLEEQYHKLHPGMRQQLPSPYNKKSSSTEYNKFGAFAKQNGVKFVYPASHRDAESIQVKLINEESEIILDLEKDLDGNWSLDAPHITEGQRYQYIVDGVIKIDPFARTQTVSTKENPTPCSVVTSSKEHKWRDAEWMSNRSRTAAKSGPMNIYEVHPTTFKKKEDGTPLNYRELADKLVAHCKEYKFTHVELMGILDHPCEASLGYQVSGFFAPNSRLGTPEDFKHLVETLHENKISVVLDWIPAHFSSDSYNMSDLEQTDKDKYTSLRHYYGWGTRFFDYRRKEVRDFLLSSAHFWLKEMHIDGLRVDAVRNICEAKDSKTSKLFLRDLNAMVHSEFQGALTISEEYSGKHKSTEPFHKEGLGFDMKWNIGRSQKMLNSFFASPDKREDKYQTLVQAVECDRYKDTVTAFSHDEAKAMRDLATSKNKKGAAKQLENMRSMMGLFMASPGKKLMFMGSELATSDNWENSIGRGPGFVTKGEEKTDDLHEQYRAFMKKLGGVYQDHKALWEVDSREDGFEWLEKSDEDSQLLAFRRKPKSGNSVLCFNNFSGRRAKEFSLPLPKGLDIEEYSLNQLINSASDEFGGSSDPDISIKKEKNREGKFVGYRISIPPRSTVLLEELKGKEVDATNVKKLKAVRTYDLIGIKKSVLSTIQKIKSFAKKVIVSIGKFLTFPLRYFGSKSWSIPGVILRLPIALYKKALSKIRSSSKAPFSIIEELFGKKKRKKTELSGKDVRPFIKYAAAAAAVHSSAEEWIKPWYDVVDASDLEIKGTLPGDLTANGKVFFDKKSGLKVMISESNNKILVSFGALGSDKSETGKKASKKIGAGIGNLLGYSDSIYDQANEFISLLKKSPLLEGKELTLCGQSLGGAIASYVGLQQGITTRCLNSMPLGAGLQKKIGSRKLDDAEKYVTHISVKKDYLSDIHPVLGKVDAVINKLGFRTAGNFGKRFLIPSAYNKRFETHSYIFSSMLKHAGMENYRTKPWELKENSMGRTILNNAY